MKKETVWGSKMGIDGMISFLRALRVLRHLWYSPKDISPQY